MTAERMDEGDRHYGSQHGKPGEAVAAIKEIGADGLPLILHKLGRKNQPVVRWIQSCAFKCGVKYPFFANPDMQRAQAVTALLALPSLPDGALDQLQKLSSNPTNSIGVSARFGLMANTNSDLKEPIAHFP